MANQGLQLQMAMLQKKGRGIKPVFKLTTKDGKSIKTTGNHPYLVKIQDSLKDGLQRDGINTLGFHQSEWRKVSELNVGDEIAVPKEKLFTKESEEYGGYSASLANPEDEHPSDYISAQAVHFNSKFPNLFREPPFKFIFYSMDSSVNRMLFCFVNEFNQCFSSVFPKLFSQNIRYSNYSHTSSFSILSEAYHILKDMSSRLLEQPAYAGVAELGRNRDVLKRDRLGAGYGKASFAATDGDVTEKGAFNV